MLDEDRLKHSLGVANKMYRLASQNKKYGISPKDAFTLGILHDIGYKFDRGAVHQEIGGNILKANGYRYWREVYYHGRIQDRYFSGALTLLNICDLTVDSNGNEVTFLERFEDIAIRTNYNEVILANVIQLAHISGILKESIDLEEFLKRKPKVNSKLGVFKFSEDIMNNIKIDYENGDTLQTIGAKYKCSPVTVRNYVNRLGWSRKGTK